MSDIATNLRRTRADMLGTEDEEHYWHCHEAADEIERLQKRNALLEDVAVAADSGLLRKHIRGEIYAGHTVDALERALDKLRGGSDE